MVTFFYYFFANIAQLFKLLMDIQEQLSKIFFSTTDFVWRSTETLQTAYQQLMENRQVSLEEGQKMYEEFLQNTEERRAEFEAQLAKILERVAENLHIATTKQLADLQASVEALEKRLEVLEQKERGRGREG
ncbi:MAG: hypothetical protein EAZ95_16040 [Bacteroidetes bacterium]|nr:MAG: hypothetical protein EAZ95_16040 [Bacteroidota bacterium]